MDHKIVVQKKSVWGPILIILLIILIIAAAGVFLVVRLQLTQNLMRVEAVASSLAVTTTRVKEGVYELKLDNITGTVRSAQSVDLNWQTSGTVSHILVSVGDKVETSVGVEHIDDASRSQQVEHDAADVCSITDEDVLCYKLLHRL